MTDPLWVKGQNQLYVHSGSQRVPISNPSNTEGAQGGANFVISSPEKHNILQHNGTIFTNTLENLNSLGINCNASSAGRLSVDSENPPFNNSLKNCRVAINKTSATSDSGVESPIFQRN